MMMMWIWNRKIRKLWKRWWISRWLFQPGRKDGEGNFPAARSFHHLAIQMFHQLSRQKIPVGRCLWRALLARGDLGWHRMLSFSSPLLVIYSVTLRVLYLCYLLTFPISLWIFLKLFLGIPSHDMCLDTRALTHGLWNVTCSQQKQLTPGSPSNRSEHKPTALSLLSPWHTFLVACLACTFSSSGK